MKYGSKKGQKPKKPIKQKPVKAMTGLEIALLAGAAGAALGSMAGGKKQEAMPLNNPAAMIAPLSSFVGKKEEEKKPAGMKKGGSVNRPGLWANINRRKKLGISRPKSQKKVGKVMREFKAGKLHSGKKGPVVKSRKQAIAIALSEAGKSKKMKSGGMSDRMATKGFGIEKKRGGGMATRGMGMALRGGGILS